MSLLVSPQFVCQGMLWKLGDSAFEQQEYTLASAWYLAATRPVFEALSSTNFPKSRRKAALAELKANRFAKAEHILRLQPADDASDHYVLFLCAALQGREEEGEWALVFASLQAS